MTSLMAENVSLDRGGRTVLDAVSVSAKPGEMVVLIGPNGTGKSTLLRALTGELKPQCGRCLVDGLNVQQTPSATLARRRAVLPQDSSTEFPLTVDDVVTLGRAPWRRHATPAQNRRAAMQALAAVDANALRQRDYRGLSGGERQRVQLARVLTQVWDTHWDGQPRYLLLDEPTASLDVGHQQRLLAAVRQILHRGIGVLAVLHDLNLAAAFADRVYLMDHGRIRAEGAPAAVIVAANINPVYGAELDVRVDTYSRRPLVLPRTAEQDTECDKRPTALAP